MATYRIMVRQAEKPKMVAQTSSEAAARRLKDEWIDRLADDGVENPEESVYVVMR